MRRDCAKHNVTANFTEFKAGHAQGLGAYCTFDTGKSLGESGQNYNAACSRQKFPSFDEGYRAGIYRYCDYNNGYELGARGKPANPVCPEQDFPSYSKGYARGIEKHELTTAIHDLEHELESIDEMIDAVNERISELNTVKYSDTLPTGMTRQEIASSLKYKNAEKKRLLIDHRRLERELRKLNAEYELEFGNQY